MIIGLTGPVGAGKTQAAKILSKLGFAVIDADEVGHQLLAKNPLVRAKAIKAFGTASRPRIRTIVFANKNKLKQLNKIIHPILRKEILSSIDEVENKVVFMEAAVLKEMGLLSNVDQVWLITAPFAVRLKRIVLSKKISQSEAKNIIKSQMPEEEYVKLADVVIENGSTLKELKREIKRETENLIY